MNVYLQIALQVTLALAFSFSANAQDTDTFYFDDLDVELTLPTLEIEKLDAVELAHRKKITELERQEFDIQNKLREQRNLRDIEFEASLSEEGLRKLNALRRKTTQDNVKSNAAFLASYSAFSSSIASAETISIFQGLPRAPQAYLDEQKAQFETVVIENYDFYRAPVKGGNVTEKLRSMVTDHRRFMPYTEGKMCGGFHPDICLQWEAEKETRHVLICLNCGEMMYVSGDQKTVFDFGLDEILLLIEFAKTLFVEHDHGLKNPMDGGMF